MRSANDNPCGRRGRRIAYSFPVPAAGVCGLSTAKLFGGEVNINGAGYESSEKSYV